MTDLRRTVITAGLSIVMAFGSASIAAPKKLHLEAEKAQQVGTTIAHERAGFSGTGYVTGFVHDGDKIVFTVPKVVGGLYQVHIRYSAPSGEKGYVLTVNGHQFSGMFAATGNVFATQNAGTVELNNGVNTITMEKGWGYYDIDALDFVPASLPPALHPISAKPIDPQATPAARALLASLMHVYGSKTLSGQYDQKDNDYIHAVTGKTPAIYGGDLIDYSPSRIAFGADPKDTTEQIIRHAKSGQIVTVSWHWNAPTDLINKKIDTNASGQPVDASWYRGFYTEATTFDVEKALNNPHSEEYHLLLRDIDAIAVQLKKFSDANVPVLWRPLHEAEGGWFWWGAKGPKPFIRLWRLMHDRLTNVHHLHNLIWVDSSGTKPEWYPGDQYVDIVGVDEYPSDVTDPLSSTWETLMHRYNGKKLVALTEFGGVPNIPEMRRYGVRWAYFVSWTDSLGPKKMTKDALTHIYQSKSVLAH